MTALLGIARTIFQHGITFRSNVELVAFAGEEQGLRGSRAYACEHCPSLFLNLQLKHFTTQGELRAANADILIMIQADMLAYRARGERPQLGLPAT